MNKLVIWLEEEASVDTVVLYGILAAFLTYALKQTIDIALVNWNMMAAEPQTDPLFGIRNAFTLTDIGLFGPFTEEFLFRFVPFTLLILGGVRAIRTLLIVNIVLAILFGSYHPYSFSGNLMVGVGAFLFGLVFLKGVGLTRNFGKALFVTTLSHSLTNCIMLFHAWWIYNGLVSKC